MTTPLVLTTQPFPQRIGTDSVQLWQLTAGRALSFQAQGPTELHVTQGRIWATLDGPHGGVVNAQGDLVLQSGDCLTLAKGQRIVIESWAELPSAAAARLLWRVKPLTTPQASEPTVPLMRRGWLAAWRSWLAPLGARATGFGRLGAQRSLQRQASPCCHGVG